MRRPICLFRHMHRPLSTTAKRQSALVAMLIAGVVALCAAGCGGAAKPTTTGPTRLAAAVAAAGEGTSSNCTSEGHGNSPEVTYCEFVLRDGRRFKCQGRRFEGSQPSASELAEDKACAPLSRVAIPVLPRKVLTAMATVRKCLTNHGLQVTDGPVGPVGPGPPSGPYGVLDVGSVIDVPSDTALIAFDRQPHAANQRKHHVIRIGAGEERHGAITVEWLRTPASALRTSVRACAFG
jgi:hypothetical protein